MRLNGWQGLWVVTTVLWIGPVLVWAYEAWPETPADWKGLPSCPSGAVAVSPSYDFVTPIDEPASSDFPRKYLGPDGKTYVFTPAPKWCLDPAGPAALTVKRRRSRSGLASCAIRSVLPGPRVRLGSPRFPSLKLSASGSLSLFSLHL